MTTVLQFKSAEIGRMSKLEALRAWWLGRAKARRHFADEARAKGHDLEADAHEEAAREYERRLTAAGFQ